MVHRFKVHSGGKGGACVVALLRSHNHSGTSGQIQWASPLWKIPRQRRKPIAEGIRPGPPPPSSSPIAGGASPDIHTEMMDTVSDQCVSSYGAQFGGVCGVLVGRSGAGPNRGP